MVTIGFIAAVVLFLIYYFLVLYFEKKLITDPKEIIENFLSVLLLYVGISITYFAITGKPFLDDSPQTYNIYIFIIGFIALVTSVTHLLKEFSFFQGFIRKTEQLSSKKKK